jgi:hypothetical protein
MLYCETLLFVLIIINSDYLMNYVIEKNHTFKSNFKNITTEYPYDSYDL